ncbi:M23 family metallopeptidase [Thalassoporum mexicanum]|uniref:M23 family metallopeptidase n=1 Tax=Thalassoporum mexicanum TaxID=3457544 RepID=UPI001CED1909|nr:M23 family metallopeptidase [Pseudanabaena sp. PCC 7367]
MSRYLRSRVGTNPIDQINKSEQVSFCSNRSGDGAAKSMIANFLNQAQPIAATQPQWRRLANIFWGSMLAVSGMHGAIAPVYASVFSRPTAADAKPAEQDLEALCGKPTLELVSEHEVAKGESLAAIAQKYNITTATIMGFNPDVRNGRVRAGQKLSIPPTDGIMHNMGNEDNYRVVAKKYGLRADVLFERNGCLQSPKVVFVPGVAWQPNPILPQLPNFARAGELPIFNVGGYPLPRAFPVTSNYGWRTHPITGEAAFHSGIDLGAPRGTPVLATKDGVVEFAGRSGGYGNLIELSHISFGTRYAHLDRILVQHGQPVKKGQQIGTVGSTGRSTGPHLHFEVLAPSISGWAAIDPAPYLSRLAAIISVYIPA